MEAVKSTPEKERSYVGSKEILYYGVANAGQVFGYNMITAYISIFFTIVFGINPAIVSLMFFIVGIWDTVNDPLMGSIIDKTRTRFGKLRPYLLFVPVPLGIAIIMLFSGPYLLHGAQEWMKVVYMIVTYVVWEFFYTIGDVPFWGMSAAISPNPADRRRAIQSARIISSVVGGLSTLALSVLMDLSKNNIIGLSLQSVYMIMGIIAGVGGMALFSLAGLKTRERVVQSVKEPKLSDSFKYMFSNKPLLLIIVSNLLGTISSVANVFGGYYYLTVLGFSSLSLAAGIPGLISGFLIYAFIPKIQKYLNNRQIVILNRVIRAGIITGSFFIGLNFYDRAAVIVPLMAAQSFFVAALDSVNMVVPTQMIGETVDYMEWKTGVRNEGMAFSVLTFVGKFTGSMSTAIATALMPLLGFVVQDDVIIKQEHTDFWLWAFFTIIPAVTGLLQIIPYFFYDLVGDKLKNIEKELRARREATEEEVTEGVVLKEA